MKTYKGFNIYACDSNAYGLKYYVRTEGVMFSEGYLLRSDTLFGIKRLINELINK